MLFLSTQLCNTSEIRFQSAQSLQSGLRSTIFIIVQQHIAENVCHGNNGLAEISLVPRLGGTTLTFGRVSVHIFAGEAINRGNYVSANALRRIIIVERDTRIGTPGATVRTHERAAP